MEKVDRKIVWLNRLTYFGHAMEWLFQITVIGFLIFVATGRGS